MKEDEIRIAFEHFRRLYWLLHSGGRAGEDAGTEMHQSCYLTRHLVRQWLYDLYLDDDAWVGKLLKGLEQRVYFRDMLTMLVRVHTLSFEKHDFLKFKVFCAFMDSSRSVGPRIVTQGVLSRPQVERAFVLAAEQYSYATTMLFFIKMPKIKGCSLDRAAFFARCGLFAKGEEFILLKDIVRLADKKKLSPKELILF